MTDPLTAIFMAKGMCEHPSAELAYDVAYEELGMGQVELFHYVSELAHALTQALAAYKDAGHPGVFVYDVAEPLGHHIVDNIIHCHDLPGLSHIKEQALVLVNEAIPEDI